MRLSCHNSILTNMIPRRWIETLNSLQSQISLTIRTQTILIENCIKYKDARHSPRTKNIDKIVQKKSWMVWRNELESVGNRPGKWGAFLLSSGVEDFLDIYSSKALSVSGHLTAMSQRKHITRKISRWFGTDRTTILKQVVVSSTTNGSPCQRYIMLKDPRYINNFIKMFCSNYFYYAS